jgi:hypothetical protein
LPAEGFPFCVLRGNNLRIRLRLQNSVAAVASGVLQLDDVKLILNCYDIPQSEIPRIRDSYRVGDKWSSLSCRVNKPGSQITLSATGDSTPVKLENLRNIEAVFLLTQVRASRNVAAHAAYNFAALASTCKTRIVDKGNTALFAQNAEYVTRLRLMEGTKQFQDSNLLANLPLIPTVIDENMQKVFHRNMNSGSYVFTGDETLILSETGITTSVFVDTIAWYYQSFWIDQYGNISHENGLN